MKIVKREITKVVEFLEILDGVEFPLNEIIDILECDNFEKLYIGSYSLEQWLSKNDILHYHLSGYIKGIDFDYFKTQVMDLYYKQYK